MKYKDITKMVTQKAGFILNNILSKRTSKKREILHSSQKNSNYLISKVLVEY